MQFNMISQSCWMMLYTGIDNLLLLTALGSSILLLSTTDDLGWASGARYLI